jgi:hypothetical protein
MATLEQAFFKPWATDAHFVTYRVVGLDSFPRLTKAGPVVAELRAAGHEVEHWAFALDYDNPDHAPWDPTLVKVFKERLGTVAAHNSIVASASLCYFTRAGARFVYILQDPIPVGPEAEGMHRSLCRAWTQAGIEVDPGCSDWTRYFRLPKVTRE